MIGHGNNPFECSFLLFVFSGAAQLAGELAARPGGLGATAPIHPRVGKPGFFGARRSQRASGARQTRAETGRYGSIRAGARKLFLEAIVCNFLAGSFSAVSKPIFAEKYAFLAFFKIYTICTFCTTPISKCYLVAKNGLKNQRCSRNFIHKFATFAKSVLFIKFQNFSHIIL